MLHPVHDEQVAVYALRFVAFIDRVYDAQLSIRATGETLDLVFPEEMLAGVWAGLLGVERVGARDDFFQLGGHSLLGLQVLSRIQAADPRWRVIRFRP